MKPTKLTLLLFSFIFSFGAHSQEGLYLDIFLNNNPGSEVNIAVTIYSDANPPVEFIAVTDSNGNFGDGWVWIDAPDWTHFSTVHETCYGSMDTTWFYGDSLDNFTDVGIVLEYCESVTIPGCTNPDALNYNPNATVDDGSCLIPCYNNIIRIVIYPQNNGDEISWNLTQNDEIVASGSDYGSDFFYAEWVCLEDGCFSFEMLDSEGDGWEGASFMVEDMDQNEYASGSLSDGSYGSIEFGINASCDSTTIFGCTDPIAINYNPEATMDDGSCTYEGDCETNEIMILFNADASAILEWDFSSGADLLEDGGYTGLGAVEEYIFCVEDGCYNYTLEDFSNTEWSGLVCIFVNGQVYLIEPVTNSSSLSFDIDVNGDCELAIEGCTDPDAYNYNPSATIDDGSCEYIASCESNVVLVEIFTQNWGEEISWSISQNDEFITAGGNYGNYGYYGAWICLEDGCFTFEMNDSFGDGWNGATFTIMDTNQTVYATGTLPSGSFGTVEFGINAVCDSTEAVPGCTDPNAYNYNPWATVDDGSCASIVSCESNIVLVEIVTQEWGEEISWTISQNDEFIAYDAGYEDFSTTETWICLDDGCFTFEMSDAYGDGWNGATFTIMDINQNIYATGTLSSGSFGTVEFGINAICDSTDIIFGCTNPEATNYNPNATDDDGSCEYEFECSIDFTVAPDTTGAQVIWITPSENIFNALWVEWDFGDGNTSSDLFPVHTYSGDGPYTLCLTAYFEEANGGFCEITYCAVLTDEMINPPGMQTSGFSINVVNPGGETTTIEKQVISENLSLWPNPTSGQAQLQFSQSSSSDLWMNVIDVTGKTVNTEQISGIIGVNTHQIDVSALNRGMYFIHLSGNDFNLTTRMIKQ